MSSLNKSTMTFIRPLIIVRLLIITLHNLKLRWKRTFHLILNETQQLSNHFNSVLTNHDKLDLIKLWRLRKLMTIVFCLKQDPFLTRIRFLLLFIIALASSRSPNNFNLLLSKGFHEKKTIMMMSVNLFKKAIVHVP